MSPRFALVLALSACAVGIPTPPTGPHRDEPVLMDYPPPAAAVEGVPPRPSAEHYWIDGSWLIIGGSYVWQPGRWQTPPEPGAYYAPATLVRRYNSPQLYYYTGRWHRADGTPLGVLPP